MSTTTTGVQPPELETVILELEPPIGRLRLHRPERLNALGPLIMNELIEAAHFFDRHLDIKVVIVSGDGRAFSAGADLRGDGPTEAPESWQARREASQLGLRLMNAVEQMRAVTIAQVHGHAVGGGFLLMCACDLRVVAEGTVFFIPEVELGLPLTWGGIPRLVREIGPAMTRELVMTCRRFDGREARDLGLVNRLVPLDRLPAEAQELAEVLAAMPGGPLVMTKDAVNAAAEAMASGANAFADGDLLLAAGADRASADARERYTRRAFDRSSDERIDEKTSPK